MATKQLTKTFLEASKNRRSVYALSKKPILSDTKVVELVQAAVKEAPSAFNVMSSRAVVLLGPEHDSYWNEIVPDVLRHVSGEKAVEASAGKLHAFASGIGTILFFEDSAFIKKQQEQFPRYAPMFPSWSDQSSGMAQIYTWTVLEAEGYGVNLQHYGNITGDRLKQKYKLPDSWVIKSEMVFGHPESPAGEKKYLPDEERIRVFGHSEQ